MKNFFVRKEIILFIVSVLALYLTSFFHFYGPDMWSKGAIPESWMITSKFAAVYSIFVLFYAFLSNKLKSGLFRYLVGVIGFIVFIPWFLYAILSSLDISGDGGGIIKIISWITVGISIVSFFKLVMNGWIQMFRSSTRAR